MRSIEDTVTVMITAVTKRVAHTTAQQNQPNVTPQVGSTLKGQREAGETILGDLVDLSAALTEPKGGNTASTYLAATMLKWRRKAIDNLTSAFTAYSHSTDMPFANRYYTAVATTYAIVADELSNAVANREKYDPLETPTVKKETPLAC